MNDASKPGVKTSEFWLALISMLLSGATTLGVLPPLSELQGATSSIASVMLCAWLGGQYISGRNGLKATEDQKRSHSELLELVKQLAQGPADPDPGPTAEEK